MAVVIPNADVLMAEFEKGDIPANLEEILNMLRESKCLDRWADILPKPSFGSRFDGLLCHYLLSSRTSHIELSLSVQLGSFWLEVYDNWPNAYKLDFVSIIYPHPLADMEEERDPEDIVCASWEDAQLEMEKHMRSVYAGLSLHK